MATNIVNGKKYIGITSQSLPKRIAQHFSHAKHKNNDWPFYRAISKHGCAVFCFEVIFRCDDYDIGLREEIRLIKVLNPEYNTVGGGKGGSLGKKMSDATKKKISSFHRGKQWRLGTKQSDDVRDNLRKIGLLPENKKRWSRYVGLGSAATARRVMCLDNGLIYPSASAAARYYSVAKSALIELCLGKRYRKTVNGLRFAYVEGAQNAAP